MKPILQQPIRNGFLYLQCEPRLQAETRHFYLTLSRFILYKASNLKKRAALHPESNRRPLVSNPALRLALSRMPFHSLLGNRPGSLHGLMP